jgi:hypothetical protein
MASRLRSSCLGLVVIVGACDSKQLPPPTAPPPSVPTVSVRVEGRVIDGEREEPLAGALITARWGRSDGHSAQVSASADDNGAFDLTANPLENWKILNLEVSRDDYDHTFVTIPPSATTSAVLRLYPARTIGPGQSIETRVFLEPYLCGFEFGPETFLCRRVTVDLPSGEPVDLEVVPTDMEEEVGLVVEGAWSFQGFQRRLTVVSNNRTVWIIVRSPAKVRLTATRSVQTKRP